MITLTDRETGTPFSIAEAGIYQVNPAGAGDYRYCVVHAFYGATSIQFTYHVMESMEEVNTMIHDRQGIDGL